MVSKMRFVIIVIFHLISLSNVAFGDETTQLSRKVSKLYNLPYKIVSTQTSVDESPLLISDYTTGLFRRVRELCGHKIVFRKVGKVIDFDLVDEKSTQGKPAKKISCQIEVDSIGAGFKGPVPTIYYNIPLHSISDTVISHEVWHLLLSCQSGIYTSGYASPLYDHLIKKIPEEAPLFEVFTHVNTILHHTFIFKKMSQVGYQLKDSFTRFTNSVDSYPPYPRNVSRYHIAIDVWHLKSGSVDHSLRIAEVLSNIGKRFPEAFDLGARLYEISKDFTDPKYETRVFKRILAELFDYEQKINFMKGDRGNTKNFGIYH